MAQLGGQDLGGIGFGLGTDRTYLACRAEGLSVGRPERCDVFLVPLGDAAKTRIVALGGLLRVAGVRTDIAYGDRGLKGAMKAADRSGARYAVIVGDRDLESGVAQLKRLNTGEQSEVLLTGLVDVLKERLA